MYKPLNTRAARQRRHRRLRVRLHGTEQRPRLSVFRSLQHIYAQIIDDGRGVTLASASTAPTGSSGSKTDQARAVGRTLAERARAQGIQAVVFDRSGYLYHGRVKALADGAREAGLEF
jgi:large subunit ribosomal protein L18